MDQESDAAVGETEIGKELSLVELGDSSRRLELHHDLFLDEQIESIPTVEEESVVAYAASDVRQSNLRDEARSTDMPHRQIPAARGQALAAP
jgi:hypothetical protein